jgi:hypothetical protein
LRWASAGCSADSIDRSEIPPAQFLDGDSIQGNPLGLKIAAGNVPNFVDLQTGGRGMAIQDALNSSKTTTMANFATLPTILVGCTTQVKPNACICGNHIALGQDAYQYDGCGPFPGA